MTIFAQLGVIINTAYTLFCFALAIWAGYNAARGQGLSGSFWGAMWMCTLLAVIGLVVWLMRTLAGEQLRAVYLLYELFFIVVLPGTFAILRGRDDRTAAMFFSGVALFAALSAISASDPTRAVINTENDAVIDTVTDDPQPTATITTAP
jgi:CDP-diglyceride synthetase